MLFIRVILPIQGRNSLQSKLFNWAKHHVGLVFLNFIKFRLKSLKY